MSTVTVYILQKHVMFDTLDIVCLCENEIQCLFINRRLYNKLFKTLAQLNCPVLATCVYNQKTSKSYVVYNTWMCQCADKIKINSLAGNN